MSGSQELSHDVELVIARKNLLELFLSCFRVLLLDELRVVLDDVGQTGRGEDLLPEIVGLQAVWIRRISCAVVPAAIEREEPRGFAIEVRAEADLVIVNGEM